MYSTLCNKTLKSFETFQKWKFVTTKYKIFYSWILIYILQIKTAEIKDFAKKNREK